MARKQSCETKGVYPDIRAGVWCRSQTSTMTVSPCTKMWVMHFASLMEGGKLAWLDPMNKKNSFLQNSVARGLWRCTVFRHDTPDFIVTYLVGLGNDTNADAAETNQLQRLPNALGIARRGRKAGRSKVLARHRGEPQDRAREFHLWGVAVGKSSATMKGAGVSSGILRK